MSLKFSRDDHMINYAKSMRNQQKKSTWVLFSFLFFFWFFFWGSFLLLVGWLPTLFSPLFYWWPIINNLGELSLHLFFFSFLFPTYDFPKKTNNICDLVNKSHNYQSNEGFLKNWCKVHLLYVYVYPKLSSLLLLLPFIVILY